MPCDRDNTIMTIRVFVRYLRERGLLPDNLPEKWMQLFRLKKVNAKKISSVYTQEEVEEVLRAIDRSHPQGKRDSTVNTLQMSPLLMQGQKFLLVLEDTPDRQINLINFYE